MTASEQKAAPEKKPKDKTAQELMLNALKEIKALKRQLAGYEKAAHEPIAVIGMGCRLPGQSVNPQVFWEHLRDGKDCITQQTNNERWNMDDLYDPDPDVPGKIYSKGLGIIERPDMFDAEFFGISPREAEDIDPQHRIFLEVCFEAMEDAGYAPSRLNGSRTGVFAGIASADYAHLGSMFGTADKLTPWQGIGNAASAAPCRISYLYNFKGPALGFDTACSSSLVALHYACQSLRNHECDAALTGGVHLVLNPAISIVFAKARMLSADGLCKTFDAAADGYVRSEGAGAVLLKRLSDAQRDGDNILAVIRGSAINQDGKSQGFTAPNESAQEDVIRAALQQARLQPNQVSYVEAHGTGTPLGDPIELGALNAVYCKDQNRSHPLLVGSAKTNMGHSEAAAGIAGFIKLVLSLQHRTIPPHLHFKTPNPYIPWNRMAIKVADQLTDWNRFAAPDGKLRGGVSAFAFTGTNAHVIVEEYQTEPTLAAETPWVPPLILTSAKQPLAAVQLQDALKTHMDVNSSLSLAQIARTCATGRDHYKHRTVFLPQSREHLQQLLIDKKGGVVLHGSKQKPKYKIGFLFSGQGAQFAGMGQVFHDNVPVFREYFDEVAALINPQLTYPLHQLLWGEHSDKLDQTCFTQPALFALEMALARTWMQWGVKPDCVAGHSVGEIAAACLAGVFSLADACKLVCHRARLMGETPRGAMLVVFASETYTRTLLEQHPQLDICAVNGPHNTVVGGDAAAITTLETVLKARDVQYRRLPVQHAFHTASMDAALVPFADCLNDIAFAVPRMRLFSNLDGEHVGKAMARADYWVQQIRKPVRFLDCARSMLAADCDIVLEIGPGSALISMLQDIAGTEQKPVVAVSSLQKKGDSLEGLTRALAQLYVAGLDLDWTQVMPINQLPPVQLPTYPFQRKSFWNETLRAHLEQQALPDKARNWLYRVDWQPAVPVPVPAISEQPWLLLFPTLALAEEFSTRLQQVDRAAVRCGHYELGSEAVLLLDGESIALGNHGESQRMLRDKLQAGTRLVVSFACLNADASAATLRGLTALMLSLAKTVQQSPGCEWWLMTEAAQQVGEQAVPVRPEQALVLGFAKNLMLELADKFRGVIDVDIWNEATVDQVATGIAGGFSAPWISLRQQQFLQPQLARVNGERLSRKVIKLDPHAHYVIAGGTGSIGLAVAKWLIEKGARQLALLSRRGMLTADSDAALAQWQQKGVSIQLCAVDLADRQAVAGCLERLRQQYPIKGVIHAAGQFELCPLQELDTERCESLMANKTLGLQWLDECSRADALDFFAAFSSIASVWGSAGNFHYAAANQVVDAIMQRRHQQGLPALVINWGPWAQSGMLSDTSAEQASRRGLQVMDMNIGVQTFGRLLNSDEHQLVVADVQWSRFRPLMDMLAIGRVFGDIQDVDAVAVPDTQVELNQEDLAFKAELAECPSHERADRLLAYLRQQLARAMQLEQQEIDDTQPLIDMGIDSLLAVEFKNRVTQVTEVELPVVRLLGGASLRDVATWMADGYAERQDHPQDDDAADADELLVEGVL